MLVVKRETLFLKIAISIIGAPVVALCAFVLPKFPSFYAEWLPKLAYLRYPIVIFFYVTAIPFFFALFRAFNILTYIDKNEAFSDLSVKALKHIKHCAVSISLLYIAGMPFFYLTADLDDAPGIIIIGLMVVFGALVVAVFAAVLQKLLQKAIEIKTENDLTI
ncbi:Uncharacterized conserved protein [Anoxybacillus flavithermus WK1]|uniref:Uncharacterized conserved protein n=1 Tax=Anoxybacillus flavithermus (strain DSM 21510 / WK1) TaxID=491915 RepID=B7GJW1_ANOFW|nr:Uncharacterized conserved protein [Anoxybacillus flavithermus WK1]